MIGNVLTLVATLLDIILLRKGPDAIPRSFILFFVTVAMWLASGILLTIFIEEFDIADLRTGILTAIFGWMCYAVLLNISRKSTRLLQTISSSAGCGALLMVAFVVGNKILEPLFGADQADFAAYLVLMWSLVVEGHIISRAIDRSWFAGFMIASAVFILQIYLDTAINPVQPAGQ